MRIWLLPLGSMLACAGTLHAASPAREASIHELIRKHPDAVRDCGNDELRIRDVTPSLPFCQKDEPMYAPSRCILLSGPRGEDDLCTVGDPDCCQMAGGEQRCIRERIYVVCDVLRFYCDARNGCVPESPEPVTYDRG